MVVLVISCQNASTVLSPCLIRSTMAVSYAFTVEITASASLSSFARNVSASGSSRTFLALSRQAPQPLCLQRDVSRLPSREVRSNQRSRADEAPPQPAPRSRQGRVRHQHRTLLRSRLRLRRHAALAHASRQPDRTRRAPRADPLPGGLVGVDLYLVGHQLARTRALAGAHGAHRPDAASPRALDLAAGGVRPQGARLRRRLRRDAGRALAVHALGSWPTTTRRTSATFSALRSGSPAASSPARRAWRYGSARSSSRRRRRRWASTSPASADPRIRTGMSRATISPNAARSSSSSRSARR